MENNQENNPILLEVNDLKKSFGTNHVLRGISTTVQKGDVIAIIGPSGCGKSTFLRSLNLLEEPTSGTIAFEGTNITDPSADINKTREKIGMVFQQFNLFPNMTVQRNITLAPVKLGLLTVEEAAARAKDCWNKWDCRIKQMPILPCSSAVRSSELPSPAPLPCSRISCCLTNPPLRWIQKW